MMLVNFLPMQYEKYDLATNVICTLIVVPIMAGLCACLACAPAGLIGVWRSLRRSSWSVWGGLLVIFVLFFVLFFLLVMVAMMCGPAYLSAQSCRVRQLKAEVAEAEAHLTATSAAIR